MNWFIAALIGAAGGLGLFMLLREFVPSVPSLGGAISRLEGQNTYVEVVEESPTLSSRLGIWAQRRLQGRGIPGLTARDQDLAVLGKLRHVLLGEKVLGAGAGFLFAPVVIWLLSSFGISLPPYVIIPVPLVLALAGWILPDILLKDQAKEAREDFARSASAYLDLLSIGRISGMMANEALSSSAQISENWAFQRINGALNRARWSGSRPWDAIAELEEELDIPELGDIGDIMRLSGEGGAQIYETLRGRARALRSAQLAREHATANRESERMTIPMTLTSVLVLIVVAYPAAVTLLGN
ncbi:MAG: type II secretion system F family protein [bacterium]|nr:type II secretion system F family protein [bacterium]